MKSILCALVLSLVLSDAFAACDENQIAYNNDCIPSKFEVYIKNITTSSPNDYFAFRIVAKGTFYVDWGDGTVEPLTWQIDDAQAAIYAHKYREAGNYVVRFGGVATGYNSYGGSAIQFGNDWYGSPANNDSGIATAKASEVKTKIKQVTGSLGALFPTIGDVANLTGSALTSKQPSFAYVFSGCTELTNVPNDLFRGISGKPRHSMFLQTFLNCSSLTGTLANGFFGNLTGDPAEIMFASTFSGCTNLTGAIPDRLFGYFNGVPAEGMFGHTFENCKKLTGTSTDDPDNPGMKYAIPPTLFSGIHDDPAEMMFMGTFKGCSGLTGTIPKDLFSEISGSPQDSIFNETFYDCENLTGPIPSGLFGNLTNNTASYMFWGTFMGCKKLTAIQPGVFGNLTGEPTSHMFAYTFKNCENLTGSIPSGLFGDLHGAPKANMFDSTFYGCKNLSGPIPENLFGHISGKPDLLGSMFSSTFYDCTNLGKLGTTTTYYIPPKLFAGITTNNTNNGMRNIFTGTGLKTSCPKDTPKTNDANTGFDTDFSGKKACVDYQHLYCRRGTKYSEDVAVIPPDTAAACVTCDEDTDETCPEFGDIHECPPGYVGDSDSTHCIEQHITLYMYKNVGHTYMGPYYPRANFQVTLPANAFTRDNYVFKCWCVARDDSCSGCSSTYIQTDSETSCTYNDQQSITTSDQDMYLCAQWDPQGAIITFNKNSSEADGTMEPMLHLEAGTHRLNMNTYSRPNYQFKCWATSISGDCVYDDGAEITVTENQEINLYAKWAQNGVITVRTPVTGIDDINLYTIFNDGVFLDADKTLRMATDANPMTIPTIPAESVRYVDVNGNIHDNFENAIISLHSQDMQVQELTGYKSLGSEHPLVIDERGYITENGLTIGKSLEGNVYYDDAYWDGALVGASLPVSSLWTPESKSGYAFDAWYVGKFNGNKVRSLTTLVVPGETNFDAGKIKKSVIFAQWDGNRINLNWLAGDGHSSAKTDVPSEYTVLDYIKSDGQQVIDTGITGNAKWEITAQATEYTTTPDASTKIVNVLVARGETSLNWFGSLLDVAWSVDNSRFNQTVGDLATAMHLNNWGAIKTGYLNELKQWSEFTSVGVPADQKTNIIVNFASDYIAGMVNERSFHDMIIETPRSIARSVPSYHLFGYTSESNFFKGKLYGAKAIQDGRLVFNGVPVKRNADGVETVGLYDTVSRQFFGNSGGGSFVAGDTVNIKAPDFCIYGTKFTMPTALMDSGYTFNNWKINRTDIMQNADTVEVSCDFDTLGVYEGSATITAQWADNTHTITLDNNDGNGGTDAIKEVYGVKWTDINDEEITDVPELPTKEGNVFTGYWENDTLRIPANGSLEDSDTLTTTIFTEDITLTAGWTNCKPDGYLDTIGAADKHISDVSVSVSNNRCVYTVTCAAGYGSDGSDITTDTIAGADAFASVCTANTFDVIFDNNGGNGQCGDEGNKITCSYDADCVIPSGENCNIVKDSKTLIGWNTNANGSGTPYNVGANIKNIVESGSVTLYAQWSGETYTVSFEKNATDAQGNKNSVNCEVGTDCNIKNDREIKRTNYDFIGWSTNSESKTAEYTTTINQNTANDVDLYAVWQPKCVKQLHIGNDTVCLYKVKISSANMPTLALRIDGDVYYAAMSLESEGKTMNADTMKKLHLRFDDKIYNVHDYSVME